MTPTGRTQASYGTVMATTLLIVACVGSNDRGPIDIHQLGPQVGELVPDFTLPDQHGRSVSLHSILGPNGAILLFHRSADW